MQKGKILIFQYNDVTFHKKVKSLVSDERVFYSTHAKKRMRERDITFVQILNCLEKGKIEEVVHQNIKGNWQATLGYFTGGDYVKVAACICAKEDGELILIITVMT